VNDGNYQSPFESKPSRGHSPPETSRCCTGAPTRWLQENEFGPRALSFERLLKNRASFARLLSDRPENRV